MMDYSPESLILHHYTFHVQLIALDSHAITQGALLVSGLQAEHVYFIFFL
jgi:hypothetical protein